MISLDSRHFAWGVFSVSFVSYLDNLPVQCRNSAGHEKGSVLIAPNPFWTGSSLCLPWTLSKAEAIIDPSLQRSSTNLHTEDSYMEISPTPKTNILHKRWCKIIWDNLLGFCGHRTDDQSESTEGLRHLLPASLPQWHRSKSYLPLAQIFPPQTIGEVSLSRGHCA